MTNVDLSVYETFSYTEYMARFFAWGEPGEGAKYDLKMQGYIRLNQSRSQRIAKTLQLQTALLARLEAIKDRMVWLVITEPWCGDSAQNLPLLAAAVAVNPDMLALKIVLRDDYPLLMNNFLTNGAKAIPKMIAFDALLQHELFMWGPRPMLAQELLTAWKTDPAGKTWEDFEQELHTWYARDKTMATQTELIHLLEKVNI